MDIATELPQPKTAADMNRFTNETGFRFHGDDSQKREQFRDILFRCGIKIKDHGGIVNNEYFLLDRQGKKIRTLNETEAMNTAIHNYKKQDFIC